MRHATSHFSFASNSILQEFPKLTRLSFSLVRKLSHHSRVCVYLHLSIYLFCINLCVGAHTGHICIEGKCKMLIWNIYRIELRSGICSRIPYGKTFEQTATRVELVEVVVAERCTKCSSPPQPSENGSRIRGCVLCGAVTSCGRTFEGFPEKALLRRCRHHWIARRVQSSWRKPKLHVANHIAATFSGVLCIYECVFGSGLTGCGWELWCQPMQSKSHLIKTLLGWRSIEQCIEVTLVSGIKACGHRKLIWQKGATMRVVFGEWVAISSSDRIGVV